MTVQTKEDSKFFLETLSVVSEVRLEKICFLGKEKFICFEKKSSSSVFKIVCASLDNQSEVKVIFSRQSDENTSSSAARRFQKTWFQEKTRLKIKNTITLRSYNDTARKKFSNFTLLAQHHTITFPFSIPLLLQPFSGCCNAVFCLLTV